MTSSRIERARRARGRPHPGRAGAQPLRAVEPVRPRAPQRESMRAGGEERKPMRARDAQREPLRAGGIVAAPQSLRAVELMSRGASS